MIRRPPRSTLSSSSAASDVYKRQLYVSAVVVTGILFLAVMIFNTLRQKGNTGDSRVGMLKAGLRYFQLAALAASFPLQWPPEVKELFGFMDGVTSATSAV